MRSPIQALLLIIVIGSSMCSTPDTNSDLAGTLLMNADYLATAKTRIKANDQNVIPAFDQLIKDAEVALTLGPFSVTDKEKLPPSGDKQDYASYSRYWWPDPSKPDGLPYIRRDGETNPQSQSLIASDRQRIGSLGDNTETLGLAYYLTGEVKYATKAAELIRVWFLDTNTRMNPNLNHSQCRLGHNNGSKTGILDGRLMVKALEGSLLIANSAALTEDEYTQLKSWSGQYFEWLTTNDLALAEAKSKNNHGSFYDAQALYFALYSGEQEAAVKIAQDLDRKRVLSQIREDGSMPEEIARTRPLFYSIYNLQALFLGASMASNIGVDIWTASDDNPRLKAALDFLVPYADMNHKWPNPTLGEADRMELLPILQMANLAYPDGNYLEVANQLPPELRNLHRSNIAFPTMQ